MTDLFERASRLPSEQREAFMVWARRNLIRMETVRKYPSAGALAQALDPTTVQTADLRVIDEQLEWAFRTPGARLMISKPSQTGKSQRVAIWGMIRALLLDPDRRIIIATHSEDLARDHSQAIRTILRTYGSDARDSMTGMPLPDRLGIGIGDKAAAGRWSIAGHRGGLVAAGVGTALPGKPADCLTGETEVITRSGRMRMDELVGTENRPDVLSYNHATGALEWRPVLAARTIPQREIVEVVTRGGHTIRCTADHRIWTAEGYRPAAGLSSGTVLLALQPAVHDHGGGAEQQAGEPDHALHDLPCDAPQVGVDTVLLVRRGRGEGEPVYDIQVARNSNFFANEVLVHNCLLLDDLYSGMLAADSPAERRRVNTWWDSVASQRPGPDAPIVMIGTRWNEEDAHAYLLEQEPDRWKVLNFPAIAEPGVLDSLGREPGVPLENPRGLTDWAARRDVLPARVWSSMYQGSPTPSDGALFNADWFKAHRLPETPALYRRVIGVDPAETGSSDEVGLIAGGLAADGTVVLTDDWSGQYSSAVWPRRACLMALATQASELVFEAYSAPVAYERLLVQAFDDLAGEAVAGDGTVEVEFGDGTVGRVRVPASRPFLIKPWTRQGNAVVRSSGLRYAMSSGRCRVVGHRLATMEAVAIRWFETQHCPDRVAAATIVYDELSGGGGTELADGSGDWGSMPSGM